MPFHSNSYLLSSFLEKLVGHINASYLESCNTGPMHARA
jgi:hypothetical protein